jgi:hypothetical protein
MPRTRFLARAAAVGLAALAAAACASVPAEDPAADAPPVPRFVSAAEIAEDLGLLAETSSAGDRVELVAGDGSRILLFPGTAVAAVAGTRLDLSEPVATSRGDVLVRAEDATAIRTAWMARPATSVAPVVRDVTPPPPPSVSSSARPREAPPSAAAALRPSAAQRSLWSVRTRLRDWRYIVIHHSASAVGSAAEIDRWHRAPPRNWDGLGYHFVIGNGTGSADGAVEVGFRWRQQREGAHAKTDGNFMNEHGIGICLVGDFNSTSPTPAQMRSLERLCRFLTEYCRVSPRNLRLHSDVKGTECPGRHFPRAFLAWMAGPTASAAGLPGAAPTAGTR